VFKRILVANRGEIAVRIIRACRELGISPVAVYSDADRSALHVGQADEALYLGPTAPAQSYLNAERIIEAAVRGGCQAVHPGYGFLAENADFASAVADRGLTFIGPSAAAIARMGDKLGARRAAIDAGVPVVPGTRSPVASASAVHEAAGRFGYPVAIKASAGGGGKGLKVASSAAEVESALSLACKEALAYFGDGTVYVEKYLPAPKHVEVQVLADRFGTAVHFGERDCSLQRRHQKLVEETPPCIGAGVAARMCGAAVALARAINYDSAGTVECLVDGDDFYFLEMNTRIQVEHTITEAVYGFDLVKAQIRVAAGERLWVTQDQLRPHGHAIECRINAESPTAAFAPSPGIITRYTEPGGPGIRIDGAAFAGAQIGSEYDSLIAKLIAWGSDREEARLRMLRALTEFDIEGVATTIPFYRLLLNDPSFLRGDYSTATVEAFAAQSGEQVQKAYHTLSRGSQAAPALDAGASELTVEVNGKRFRVRVFGLHNAGTAALSRATKYRGERKLTPGDAGVTAPMHGVVAELRVKPSDRVEPGQVVAVIEAMKMMNEVVAQRAGTVRSVHAKPGQTVESGSMLLSFEEPA
jgi:acetyl-CoA/propionyl-CoA carboxylase biotin carboxyl carrier protein